MTRPIVNVAVGGPKNLEYTYKTIVLKSNLGFAAQIGDENTKYVVRWDYVLDSNVVMPAGCVLVIDGGSISNASGKNYKITGTNTLLDTVLDKEEVIRNVTLDGTWRIRQYGAGGLPDKEYDPDNYSGLGRKTLLLDGDSNILTQDDFDKDHTVYIISYDFDLNGQTIEMPEGCVLEFDGGSISNGKVVSNHTKLINYSGNGDILLGAFYDYEGSVLSYNGKRLSDIHASEILLTELVHDYTYLNPTTQTYDTLKVVMNQQSILVTDNNIIIFGIDNQPIGYYDYSLWPWPPRIVVFDRNMTYIKTITDITGEGYHFNDVTLCDGYVYSAGRHISRCLLSDILNNSSVTFEMVEDRESTAHYGFSSIDYDSVSEEFCAHYIDYNADLHTKLKRYSKNWTLLSEVQWDYQHSLYGGEWIADNSGWYKNGIYHKFVLINHDDLDCAIPVVHIAVNALTGEVLYEKPVNFGRSPYNAIEGAFKDPDNDNVVWCMQNYPNTGIIKSYMIIKVSETEADYPLESAGYPANCTDKVEEFNGKIFVDNTYSGQISDGTQQRPFTSFKQAYLTGRQATIRLIGTNTPYYIDVKLNGKPVKIEGRTVNGVAPTIYGKIDMDRFSHISVAGVIFDMTRSNNLFSGYNSQVSLDTCRISGQGNLFNGAFNKYEFANCQFVGASTINMQASVAYFLGTNTFNDGAETVISCSNSCRIFSNNNVFTGNFTKLIDSGGAEVLTMGVYDMAIVNSQNLGSSDLAIRYVLKDNLLRGSAMYYKGIYYNMDGKLYAENIIPVTSAERAFAYRREGISYFDKDLGKPIYYNGNNFVDALGKKEEVLTFMFGSDAVGKSGFMASLNSNKSCTVKSNKATFSIKIGEDLYTEQSEFDVPAGSSFTVEPESNDGISISVSNKEGLHSISYNTAIPIEGYPYHTYLYLDSLEYSSVDDLYLNRIIGYGTLDLSTLPNFVRNGHNLVITSKVNAKGECKLIIPRGTNLGSGFDTIRVERLNSQYEWSSDPAEFNLSSLHGCTALTTLTVPHAPNVTGSIDDMLDAMHTAGRNSGTLVIQLGLTNCTYGGVVLDETYVNQHGWNITATFSNEGWTAVQS